MQENEAVKVEMLRLVLLSVEVKSRELVHPQTPHFRLRLCVFVCKSAFTPSVLHNL